MTRPVWAVVPAAGRGRRFGGDVPKQYLQVHGQPLLAYALDALLAEPRIEGAIVAIGADDAWWPGWTARAGKPVLTCTGGAERADSVLAALDALDAQGHGDALVAVHDAARPNLDAADLSRLLDAALADDAGAILAAPARDTLKRGEHGRIAATQSREALWRAFTPQAFPLPALRAALARCRELGVLPTDEAMAMELAGIRPRLVEGREDNLKVTTQADLALVEFLLARKGTIA
ncbi:MAG: 2-C-methyl-D-erythritol 4-phosphate cytidylyltransferase [Pseudomonadota bacterium]